MGLPLIVGIGTDIVEIERLRRAWERTGERFLAKIFTQGELAYCRAFNDPWPHLAARFAAKESVMKALGFCVDPLQVEILRQGTGAPHVALHGSARSRAHKRGVGELKVSLSHAGRLAVAQAIAVGR